MLHIRRLLLGVVAFSFSISAVLSIATAAPQDSPDELRKWTAANQKFSITARLLAVDDGKVKLETKDGKILNVELAKLCDADKACVKKFMDSEDNPFAEQAPQQGSPKESRDSKVESDPFTNRSQPRSRRKRDRSDFGNRTGRSTFGNNLPKAVHLKFGRRNIRLQSEEYGVEISPAAKLKFDRDSIECTPPPVQDRFKFHNRVGSWALSLNETCLATSVSNPFDKKAWVAIYNFSKGTASDPIELPWERTTLLAVSDDGKKILTTNHDPNLPSRSDLWLVVENKLEHVKGWKTRGFHDHDGIELKCATMVDDERILSAGTQTALWNVDSNSDEYASTARMAGHTPKLTLSPDRKSFAVVANARIHILNILSGVVEGTLARPDDEPESASAWQEMAFSPDGIYFAARRGNDLTIWNLKDGNVADQFVVLTSGGLTWIDSRYILLGGALHDIDLRAVVWRYNASSKNLVPLSDGRILFVDKGGVSLIELPHADLADRIEQFDDDELLVLQEGDTVGLDLSGLKSVDADTKKQIRKTWTDKLEDAGAKVLSGDDFDRVVRFKVGIQKETKTEVRDFMSPFPMGGPFAKRGDKVKYKEKTASIELVVDGKVLWRTSRHFGPSPIVMHMRNGETPQQHVNRVSKVDTSFFTSRFIPEGLCSLPPDLVGESKITLRGVE